MAFESITDNKIAELLHCPKRITNPQTKSKHKDGHAQMNYKVSATDGSGHAFEVYTRQNLMVGMEDDFSCGISWIAPNGELLTIKRYNGSSHTHRNSLENDQFDSVCHIHIATEKYIRAEKKAEGFAESSAMYRTMQGAFHCLITDCNISGIQTTPDKISQTSLF